MSLPALKPFKPAFLPYGRQVIEEDDIEAVAAVLRGDYLTTGPMAGRFETKLAQTVGAKHAVVCSNGTAALYLAARALDLGPGTKIVVPAITFLATASAPHLNGAEIVFADVDPDSGLMRPQDLKTPSPAPDMPMRFSTSISTVNAAMSRRSPRSRARTA